MNKHKDVKIKDLGMSEDAMKKFSAGARFVFPGPFDEELPVKHINSRSGRKHPKAMPEPFEAPSGPPEELFHKF